MIYIEITVFRGKQSRTAPFCGSREAETPRPTGVSCLQLHVAVSRQQ